VGVACGFTFARTAISLNILVGNPFKHPGRNAAPSTHPGAWLVGSPAWVESAAVECAAGLDINPGASTPTRGVQEHRRVWFHLREEDGGVL